MYERYKNKVVDFYKSHKRMPTYREIMNLAGFKSLNSVTKLVKKLIDDGVLNKDASGKLIPHSAFGDVQMLGFVKAGFPSIVEEELTDTMNLEDYLIKKKESTYVLTVDGDSMIDAHIKHGDLVIAEKTQHAKDGQIVIAEIDGEWTMKYYRERGGKAWLEPANKNFKAMYPTQYLTIAAVVKGVVRKV
jgi:repressor LexA